MILMTSEAPGTDLSLSAQGCMVEPASGNPVNRLPGTFVPKPTLEKSGNLCSAPWTHSHPLSIWMDGSAGSCPVTGTVGGNYKELY